MIDLPGPRNEEERLAALDKLASAALKDIFDKKPSLIPTADAIQLLESIVALSGMSNDFFSNNWGSIRGNFNLTE